MGPIMTKRQGAVGHKAFPWPFPVVIAPIIFVPGYKRDRPREGVITQSRLVLAMRPFQFALKLGVVGEGPHGSVAGILSHHASSYPPPSRS
jgi:hypothetical protein